MKVLFTKNGAQDYSHFKQHNHKIFERINLLIEAIKLSPFSGIGKPEPLRYNLSGLWSRRITGEHRLVYEIKDNSIIIHQCRYHY
jgi:toxin YoeB